MRAPHQLVHSRTRCRSRYALFPIEGFPASRLPFWPEAQVKIVASPALGARFAQYVIDVPAGASGGYPASDDVETFYFVLAGAGQFTGDGASLDVKVGSFGLVPPGKAATFRAGGPLQLLVLRKKYEAAPGVPLFKACFGDEAGVKKEVWGDSPHSLLQTLIPDELPYDMAMNIFTFDAGFGLPIVETHVMEHGLYFLQGKGVYYLDDAWMEVEKDDFIWMAPFCPQSFYATGPQASRYIYYKNMNRDVTLD